MFKKIEIWILYLTLLLCIPFTIVFGVLVRQEIEGITKKGNLDISFLTKPAAYIARIPEKFLITIFIKPNPHRINSPWNENRYFYNQNSFKGIFNSKESYLLLSRYEGDLKEGIVELIDLTNFKVLHTWNPDIDEFNKLVEKEKLDDFKNIDRDHNNFRQLLHHPKMTKDGGLLFGWNTPLRKIDACSNLIFQNTHDKFHHSIETDIDGDIWVPSYMYPISLSTETVGREIIENGRFLDDAIVKLSPDGDILFEKSISQILIDNGLEYLLFALPKYVDDPIHLNDIQPVDFDGEFWKKGDVFLSLRNQSMVILYRPSTNKIIWKGTGPFFHQHDVDILNEHTISVFNNNAKNFSGATIVDGNNEVIIYNFKNNEYSFYLNRSLKKNDIRTVTEGVSQILPNGDLFLEESNFGRTLYFNSDGSLRWTHVNRAKNGKIYKVAWSRILYDDGDINIVNDFMKTKSECND